ncbi:MAG: primosomal protein, partial [Synergistaceae bacterium]|nr:primosomal protein [Synergistaceae bacterium]
MALAGPWWTNLTYLAPERLPEGARVRVPVGKGARVAVVVGPGEDGYEGELREIASVIDSTPILPSFAMPLV